MRKKLAVIALYLLLIVMPAALFADTFAEPEDAQQTTEIDAAHGPKQLRAWHKLLEFEATSQCGVE